MNVDEACYLIELALLTDDAPDPEAMNALSAHLYALDRDTPAKTWSEAPIWHPAVGRQLRIDRSEEGGVYALAPFRLGQVDGQHRILAAWPCPRLLSEMPDDHTVIHTVIAWNPLDNTATVLGDPVPQLVGRFPDSASSTLFADPRVYFQAWAIARAQFFVRWRQAHRAAWQKTPEETDLIPGMLLTGDIARVRFPADLPEHIACVGIDPKAVDRAIHRQASLPRVTGSNLRAAA